MLLVENVKKSYREPNGERLPILDVPRLELAAGEQVVIRGRSGGGKTTLLNVIAGLATVDEGRDRRQRHRRHALARGGPRPVSRPAHRLRVSDVQSAGRASRRWRTCCWG